MIANNETISSLETRFQWVTTGQSRGQLPIFDEPVAADAHGVAVPSLGSLVPGWTLLVPRRTSPNFAALGSRGRAALNPLKQAVCERLAANFDGRIFEFEHGPASYGNILGCGVDQAHVHFAPLPMDLLDAAKAIDGRVTEFEAGTSDPWLLIPGGADYYLVRDWRTGSGCIIVPTTKQSQAFRKIIANRLGCPSHWDYKIDAGTSFASQTRSAFLR